MPFKLVKKIPRFNFYKNYKEFTEKNKMFKRGVKDFKEGNLKDKIPGSIARP